MFYILTKKIQNDHSDAILDGESSYLNRIECSFQQGIPLPSEDIDTPILFKLYEYTLRGTMTDHLSVNSIQGPVFSLRAKTLFEKLAISNVEYYQLTLLDEFADGEENIRKNDPDSKRTIEYTDYFISNVVGLVDCVDHQKSIVEYFYPPELRKQPRETSTLGKNEIKDPFADENPNDIDFITKLVLDESKIDPNLKILRLSDKPDLLIFHESVVDLIRKEKLSGFVFVPVSEYTDVIKDEEENKEESSKDSTQEEQPKETKKWSFNFFSD